VNKDSKIYVAGHLGLVGSALMKKLKNQNYSNIVTKTRKDLDLKVQVEVDLFFQKFKFNPIASMEHRISTNSQVNFYLFLLIQ